MLKDGDGSCHLGWQVDGTAILEAENKPYGRHCGLSLNLKVSLALLFYQITIKACELLAHHQTQPFALPFSSQRANLCHRCHSSSIYQRDSASQPLTSLPIFTDCKRPRRLTGASPQLHTAPPQIQTPVLDFHPSIPPGVHLGTAQNPG